MNSFERIKEDIKCELAVVIRKVKDPRVDAFLSITDTVVSPDLSYCKVFVSSFNGIEKTKTSVKGLTSATKFIENELFKNLHLKKRVSLKFFADDTLQYTNELIEKIDKVNSDL
jgi:ribosome-binding factor A